MSEDRATHGRSSPEDVEEHRDKSENDDSDDCAQGALPSDRDHDGSPTPSSSQGRNAPRHRTVDGKPIPFRGLSRNPRLQLALIEAVHSFKPFGYGNVKNGWKKVQEHMNAHKLMDQYERDGVRHELSWQLCRDVFGRILDEWKISGKYQTKMDGIEIHDVERWNQAVLEIHRVRQKEEGTDDKKRRKDDDRSSTPSGSVESTLRTKHLKIDTAASRLDPTPAAPAQMRSVHGTFGPAALDISVFSPRVSWTSGTFSALAPSESGDKGPTPGMVARAEDLQRTLGQSGVGAQMAQARAIEQATAELLQHKVHLQHSLLQPHAPSALSRVQPGAARPAPQTGAGGQGVGGAGLASVEAQVLAQQQAQAQASQLQAQVLRESFSRQASGADAGHAMLERILEIMERQVEEQRAMRDVTMRTMQSLESVVKTVASLACDVADLARETHEVRAIRRGSSGGSLP